MKRIYILPVVLACSAVTANAMDNELDEIIKRGDRINSQYKKEPMRSVYGGSLMIGYGALMHYGMMASTGHHRFKNIQTKEEFDNKERSEDFPLISNLKEEDVKPKIMEQWDVEGSFGEICWFGFGTSVNRLFYIKSKTDGSDVKEIVIRGLKNGGVDIIITMNKASIKSISELVEKKIGAKDNMFSKVLKIEIYESTNKDKLDEFLSVFVKNELILKSIQELILKNITLVE